MCWCVLVFGVWIVLFDCVGFDEVCIGFVLVLVVVVLFVLWVGMVGGVFVVVVVFVVGSVFVVLWIMLCISWCCLKIVC